MTREPIDAVITWVDGNDPVHADKLANYFIRMGIVRPETAAPTRYNQCGEVNYCVKSLLRFAPWIRTIYIVTDAQTPSIMNELIGTTQEKKVKLIDHREIFCGYEKFLPTFNSLTIECMLWRIKGLSEHFIYLNDDCSIIRPVSSEDFFRGDKIVLRGEWKVQADKKWRHYLKRFINAALKKPHPAVERDLFRTVQENSANLAGWHKRFFHFPHAPFPLKKKSFEHYFLEHPEAISENLGHALRHPDQFWPLSLIEHLELKKNKVVFDRSIETITVNGACHSLKKIQQRLSRADRNKNVTFICMQSIDEAPIKVQKFMLDWLGGKI